MTAVDPIFAQWLMGDGYWCVGIDDDLAARWGAIGQTTARMTTLANFADAQAEAERQIAFFSGGGPLVTEEHSLTGAWASFIGQVITLTIDRLGYEHGLDVFVIGADDNAGSNTSTVTVLRRLA